MPGLTKKENRADRDRNDEDGDCRKTAKNRLAGDSGPRDEMQHLNSSVSLDRQEPVGVVIREADAREPGLAIVGLDPIDPHAIVDGDTVGPRRLLLVVFGSRSRGAAAGCFRASIRCMRAQDDAVTVGDVIENVERIDDAHEVGDDAGQGERDEDPDENQAHPLRAVQINPGQVGFEIFHAPAFYPIAGCCRRRDVAASVSPSLRTAA